MTENVVFAGGGDLAVDACTTHASETATSLQLPAGELCEVLLFVAFVMISCIRLALDGPVYYCYASVGCHICSAGL